MEKLETNNISIDTSFIESQNFLAGSKIRELAELCQNKSVKLFLTDITYKEIISRFQKNIQIANEQIKKPIDILSDKAKVFRNFEEMKPYFEFPEITEDELNKKFEKAFTKWLKWNSVTLIKTNKISIEELFDDYFNNRPPFGQRNKKHEFPDAVTAKALIEYFKARKSKSYLLTMDLDLLNIVSNELIPTKDSAVLFDLVIRTSTETSTNKVLALIEQQFKTEKHRLEREAKEMFLRAIEDEMHSLYFIDDLEVESVQDIDLSDIEMENYSIVSLNIPENKATLECDVNVSFDILLVGRKQADGWYDKEEDIYRFVDNKDYAISDSYDININISAEFDIEGNYIKFEVENINNGKKLEIKDGYVRRIH